MRTFLFYDTETTGLNCCFDQVLQFAAIRTDLAFNEIERHEILVKLCPDVTPSPGAMQTHNIDLAMLAQQGISEYAAIKRIHTLLNTANTISLGYNTLGFDDKILRFSFYRNLLNPYTHQYANQCSRMDLFPITVMYYLYKNDPLVWPIINDKTSLKLEHLNATNQLAQGNAHDAMVDVIATLALAKKLSEQTDMWRYCLGFFNKTEESKRLMQLPQITIANVSYKNAIMVLSRFGEQVNYRVPALYLGQHQHYKNQTAWLRLDKPGLLDLLKADQIDNTELLQYAIFKKAAVPGFIIPATEKYLSDLTTNQLTTRDNLLSAFANYPAKLATLANRALHYTYPIVENIDVQARLYTDGFWQPEEISFSSQFHAVLEKILNHENAAISNNRTLSTLITELHNLVEHAPSDRLLTLSQRLLGRITAQSSLPLLSPSQQQAFDEYIACCKQPRKPLYDYKGDVRYCGAEVDTVDLV